MGFQIPLKPKKKGESPVFSLRIEEKYYRLAKRLSAEKNVDVPELLVPVIYRRLRRVAFMLGIPVEGEGKEGE